MYDEDTSENKAVGVVNMHTEIFYESERRVEIALK